MALKLLQKTYSFPGRSVAIRDSQGSPAQIYASPQGGLVSNTGNAVLDSSGVLNVYLDESKEYTVTIYGDTGAAIQTDFGLEAGRGAQGVNDTLTPAQVAVGAVGVAGVTPTGVLVGPSGAPVSVGGGAASDRRERLAPSPVGFNSYDLLYRYLLDDSYDYSALFTYFGECGVNLVRIMYPCYSSSEYGSLVFAAGTPSGEILDSHFRSTFLTKSDAIFSAANAAGVKLYPCFFWYATAVAELHGETVLQAIQTNSQSYRFMQRFATWFSKRYGAHPAFGAFSFFNELMHDASGVAYPTPQNIGAVNAGLTETMRAYALYAVASTNFVPLTITATATRNTFVSEAASFVERARGCDAFGVHVYCKGPSNGGMSFVGFDGLTHAAFGPQTSNKLGWEGLESVLSALKTIAASMGVPLWLTETGVPSDVDADTSVQRRSKLLSVCQRYAETSLIWNAANVANPQANQVIWQIKPGSTLGNTYKELVSRVNSGRIDYLPAHVGAGTKVLLSDCQPKFCMSSTRSAGATVRVTTTAALTSTTQAVMAWIRKDTALNNFEFLLDARGAGGLSGFGVLAGGNATVDSEYADFRGPSGSARNTSGQVGRTAVGEWFHVAYVLRDIGGQGGLEVWVNGLVWTVLPLASPYAGIPASTTIYACGGTVNGAPVSMQDITFAPYAAPDDIWAHMRGTVLPQAYLHLRAFSGSVLDVSRSALAVTIGSGVTTGPA